MDYPRSWILRAALLWHCVGFCVGRGPPVIAGTVNHRQTAKLGKKFKIPCPVVADPAPLMQWSKNRKAIYDGWERYKMVQEGLRIKNVEMDDAGHYTCKATNGFGSININYTLVVVADTKSEIQQNNLYPHSPDQKTDGVEPKFVRLKKMRRKHDVPRPVGSTIRFKCKATGKPRPNVRWLKDGQPWYGDHHSKKPRWTLKIDNLRQEDSGKYTCIVTNMFGSINYTYTLEVVEKIKTKPVLLPPHPENQTVRYGSHASFQCHVKSDAQPHIQWLKRVEEPHLLPNLNTTIEVKDQKFVVLKSGDVLNKPDGSYVNKLNIKRATERDSGMYICLGANSMGYSFRRAFLSVHPDPHRFPRSQLSESPGSNNNLLLAITVPVLLILVILALVIYCLRRHRQYSNGRSNLRIQRLPIPTQDKDFVTIHSSNSNSVHSARNKIPKNHSIDICSDISSVSRNHHHQQHMKYNY